MQCAAMPEAAIDKYRQPELGENKIRTPEDRKMPAPAKNLVPTQQHD